AAGSPPDLTHLNPFMTASLYTKGLLRPMDELIRALGEKDIHEATQKLQYFDGRYYGVTHAMGGIYIAERRGLREQKGLKPPPSWSGQKYLDTLAALATGKVAMAYLSGARTIGYVERYAPEGMRDPEHFQPMFRPHGPSGQTGVSALDGENWTVFSQSKYPQE